MPEGWVVCQGKGGRGEMEAGETVFETERLRVRPWRLEDAAAAFAIYGDAEVWRYMGGGAGDTDVERSRARIGRFIERCREMPGFGMWAVVEKATGEVVGTVELVPLDGGPEIEAGYHLARRHLGRGIATEVARGAVRYGFEALGLRRIVGVVDPANVASRRVLEKCGMVFEKHGVWYGWELDLLAVERETDRRTDGQ
jgi:RimJ/RimL family protein N-acetyltransferase